MCLTLTNSISGQRLLHLLHSSVGHGGDAACPSSPRLSCPQEFGSPRSQPGPAASEVTDPWHWSYTRAAHELLAAGEECL